METDTQVMLDSLQGQQRHDCVSLPASYTRGARERVGMVCWDRQSQDRVPRGGGMVAWRGVLG